ncbi:hypothetical protein [Paenibacillus wynnii]|uniref:Uncharacterized protein n=1 Tax=Paenibacillus wynnii TaxID=268407 RepID=A0A098M695_9BACL|nr:hypothetical protein [Paenibacillus wynnii]KGE17558.1 hypothetical protein PWYN_23445 [Paenibacillus wynnii]
MDNVIFNRQDHTVAGLNRPAGPCEYSLALPFPITAVKTLTWTNGEKQKADENGQLLYKSQPILDENNQETYNEVITARIPTAWEERTQEYSLVNEDGSRTLLTNTTQVPVEWEELQPAMVSNVEQYQVSFTEQPSLFTYDELQVAKLISIKKAYSGVQLVYYDEDFEPSGFSTDLAEHAANMGDGVLAVHPNGKCRTTKLPLGKIADTIQLYLEAQAGITVEVGATVTGFTEVVQGIAQLPVPTNELYVRFTNTTDSYKEVYAFGILA